MTKNPDSIPNDPKDNDAFLDLMQHLAARDTTFWLRAIQGVADEVFEVPEEDHIIDIEAEAYNRVARYYALGPEHREEVLRLRDQFLADQVIENTQGP